MYAINRTNREVNFTGSWVRTLMSGTDTQGAFCLLEFKSPTGRATPLHMHDREEETIHLLEGELDIEIGEGRVTLRAGETILIPRKTPHRLNMVGNKASRYIVMCTPAGFDGFVEACASGDQVSWPPLAPTADDIARLKEACPRFGITLFPPKS